MRRLRLSLAGTVTMVLLGVLGTVVAQSDDANASGTFTARLLPDGRVLVAGGWDKDTEVIASAEVWSHPPSNPIAPPRPAPALLQPVINVCGTHD